MPNRSITLVRHGHREDFAGDQWSPERSQTLENPHDPDISARGISEASALGNRLAGGPPTTILASPFLRTVHTASLIAASMGRQVLVENGLHEMMHPDGFPRFPDLRSLEELRRRFENVDTTHLSVTEKNYPEWTLGDVATRAELALESILAHHEGDLVLVTHADPLLGFLMAMGIDTCRQPVRTCSIYRLEGDSGAWSLTVDGDTSHLDS